MWCRFEERVMLAGYDAEKMICPKCGAESLLAWDLVENEFWNKCFECGQGTEVKRFSVVG